MYLRSLRTLSVTLPRGLITYLYGVIPCHRAPLLLNAWRRIEELFSVIYTRYILDTRTLIKNTQFAVRFFLCGLIHWRNACTSLVLFKRNPRKARVRHSTSSFSLTSCRCAYVTASHNRCYVSRVHTITAAGCNKCTCIFSREACRPVFSASECLCSCVRRYDSYIFKLFLVNPYCWDESTKASFLHEQYNV